MLPSILLILTQGCWADSENNVALNRTDILDIFHQAKVLFRQADQLEASDPEQSQQLFRQAAMRYETLVAKAGIQNGKLYYNIGNIYFRLKDIGRAVLNYRRAQQLIPYDPNLRQNLSYVRQFRRDKIDEKPETKIFQTVFFWHYDLSVPVKIILFSTFFIVLWLLSGMRLFFKHALLGWIIAGAMGLSVMMGGSLIAETISLHQQVPGVIIDAEVVARKGNSENYAPSFTEPLHAGTEFYVREQRGDWMYVSLADERTCWLPSRSVALVRP